MSTENNWRVSRNVFVCLRSFVTDVPWSGGASAFRTPYSLPKCVWNLAKRRNLISHPVVDNYYTQ